MSSESVLEISCLYIPNIDRPVGAACRNQRCVIAPATLEEILFKIMRGTDVAPDQSRLGLAERLHIPDHE